MSMREDIRLLLFVGFMMFSTFTTKAQVDYSFYNGVKYLFNPAFTGNDSTHNVDIIGFYMKNTIAGHPTSVYFSYSGFFKKMNSGLGVDFNQNTLGYSKMRNSSIQYSYRVKDSNSFRLVFGSKIGYGIQKVETKYWVMPDRLGLDNENVENTLYSNNDIINSLFIYSLGGMAQYKNATFAFAYSDYFASNNDFFYNRYLQTELSYEHVFGKNIIDKFYTLYEYSFAYKNTLELHNTLQFRNIIFLDIGCSLLNSKVKYSWFFAMRFFKRVQLGISRPIRYNRLNPDSKYYQLLIKVLI